MESPFLKVFKTKFWPTLLRFECSSELRVEDLAQKLILSMSMDVYLNS